MYGLWKLIFFIDSFVRQNIFYIKLFIYSDLLNNTMVLNFYFEQTKHFPWHNIFFICISENIWNKVSLSFTWQLNVYNTKLMQDSKWEYHKIHIHSPRTYRIDFSITHIMRFNIETSPPFITQIIKTETKPINGENRVICTSIEYKGWAFFLSFPFLSCSV